MNEKSITGTRVVSGRLILWCDPVANSVGIKTGISKRNKVISGVCDLVGTSQRKRMAGDRFDDEDLGEEGIVEDGARRALQDGNG